MSEEKIRRLEDDVLRLEKRLNEIYRQRKGLHVEPGKNMLGQNTRIDGDLFLTGEINRQSNGWTKFNSAILPVYVSATSVRFDGIDLSSVFPGVTKIKLTQTTVKYFYVIAAAYSAGNTTLTLIGGSDCTVANAAITNFHYSHEAVAAGFPDWFNYVPTLTGWSTQPTGTYHYCVIGKTCIVLIKQATDGTSNSTTTRITLPINSALENMAACQIRNAGANVSTPGLAKVYEGLGYIGFFVGWDGTAFSSTDSKGILTCCITYNI